MDVGTPTASSARTAAPDVASYRVAVIGNPNTGKTTLFNALTGLSQHTGNYPGVTVESALGEFRQSGVRFLAVDLPGVYSLAPRAPDEMVAVSVLLGSGDEAVTPDIVLCVVDATNIALTMADLAEKQGLHIDIATLEKRLGVRVVPVQATKRRGIDQLRQTLCDTLDAAVSPPRPVVFPEAFTQEAGTLARQLTQAHLTARLPHFLVERLLIDAGGMVEQDLTRQYGAQVRDSVHAARQRLADNAVQLPQMEVDHRYAWIAQVVADARHSSSSVGRDRTDWSELIDSLVTHKVWGLAIFLTVMGVTFQSIFSWALPLMDGIDTIFSALGPWVGDALPEGPLQSLIVDGVIGGVGAVVVFVPQIAILFGLIATLEDSGYMARAAFLMDRVMAGFGLSGRSFIPLLSSFACAIPGIMATRTIDNQRDRIATILIAPLMSCSARLPVYVLLIAAFIPAQTVWGIFGLQGLTLFCMYCLGLFVAPPIAWILKRTLLSGEAVPFLMELPPFKLPAWRVVVFRMYDRSMAFLKRAGSIILATTILVWVLSYYPNQDLVSERAGTELALLESEAAGIRLRESYLGQAGRAIEPFVQPLGWDWKIGMATLASFPAREVIIAALGTIYNLGAGQDEESVELRQAMRAERWPDGRPVYTPVVAISIMVFFALCCQCGATLATIKRETNSWGYPLLTFVYMTSLAYLGALAVYQIGSWLIG